MIRKLTVRSIQTFLGRYIALLLIVALGTAFFAGLKVVKEAMGRACADYLRSRHFYDYRLYSSLGFNGADVRALESQRQNGKPFVLRAEGGYTLDALAETGGRTDAWFFLSLPKYVSKPSLKAGRMPRKSGECLADDEAFTKADLGKRIRIGKENRRGIRRQFRTRSFRIVGLSDSPLYLNDVRGASALGNGTLAGYVYIPAEDFRMPAYTEVSLTLREQETAYTAAGERVSRKYKGTVRKNLERLAEDRYRKMVKEAGRAAAVRAGVPELPRKQQAEFAEKAGIRKPVTRLLTRSENNGYVSFRSDTSIIDGIAGVFPVFFLLIAMLVSATTITRMVEEERTQIGTMKALGYGRRSIMAKYLLYAGSAAFLGWCAGFLPGTYFFPKIFWQAYSVLYDFAPIPYVFPPELAALTFLVSEACILLTAWVSCARELGEVPASLMRPKAPKAGKRVLLERAAPLWRRLTFLQKVSVRNMFRYRSRLLMMILGIACCSALLLLGFGVRDSMIHLDSWQFDRVQRYDLMVSADPGDLNRVKKEIRKKGSSSLLPVRSEVAEFRTQKGSMQNVQVFSVRSGDAGELKKYWKLSRDGRTVLLPKDGSMLAGARLAEKLEIRPGETVACETQSGRKRTLRGGKTFDNYVGNYVFVTPRTADRLFGKGKPNGVFVRSEGGDPEKLAQQITKIQGVLSVSAAAPVRRSVYQGVSCLNYLIWLIVAFSAGLAFIVIYNLTNINLAERKREIATVRVLGFTPRETASYVLRENVLMAVIGGGLGLVPGRWLKAFVMGRILIDNMTFPDVIRPVSYLLAWGITVLFAVLVSRVMRRHIGTIPMAESLKAAE